MAATDLERLVVQLSADFKQFERQMAKAEGVTNRQFRAIENRARLMNRNLDNILKSTASRIVAPLAGIGAALGTRELARLADVWTDLTSRVNLAAGSTEAGTEVMGRLGEMARRTYSSLEQTTESYINNATALRELGFSTDQQLDYTEALNNALVISAAKGDRAAAIQNALTKAMAGGKLAGDDLNTVIQQGGRVAQALAEGLGVGVNELRALGAQGKITSREVFRALTSQMVRLRKEAEAMPATIADGYQLLSNALLQYVGNADSAAGISAKISEALILMADNFDTVADAGLQLAAILAAGLLGRSIAGMVRQLGLGSTALMQFTRAISAARTMASLSMAFSGLAAAAGPAGIVIGAGLATALVVAQANAQATEERTARLRAEFERLGVGGRQAAMGVEETAEAIDNAADESRIQILKDINHELDRMRGGGSWNPFANWFGEAREEAKELGAILREAGNALTNPMIGDVDRAAYQQIMQLSVAARDGEMSIRDAVAAAQDLGSQDISEPVRRLNRELIESIEYWGVLRSGEAAQGQNAELERLITTVIQLTDQYDTLNTRRTTSPEQLAQIDDLRDRLKQGGEAAQQAARDLHKLASSSPGFEGLAETLDPLISRLGIVIQRAKEAAAEISRTSVLSPEAREAYQQYGASRVAGRAVDESSAAYEQAALRRARLGKDELALENEIARVRDQSLKDGEQLTEDRIRRIAEANLAGNSSRSAEGKKPAKERADEYERLAQRISDSTAALVAETEVQRQLNPLVDDYGYAIERARAEQELLNAAKKAGVEVTPKLRQEIAALADQYATASAESAKLAEQQDKARQKAEEWVGLQRDVTKGLIDDLVAGRSAAEAFAGALQKISDKLLNEVLDAIFQVKNAGSGGGMFGFLGSLLGLGGGGTNPYLAFSQTGQYLFDKGGYTGPGGKHQPAGVVHKGEVVWSQADIRRHGGVAVVEAMRKNLPGFANGGPVGIQAPIMPKMPRPAQAAPARQEIVLHVFAEEGEMFRPTIRAEAEGVSVRVVDGFSKEALPARVNQIANDPHAVG